MFTRKDPRKGSKVQNWHCEQVAKGKGFKAWKAAELFGVLCHWSFRSIPCYWELTDGKLDCPHCRDNPSLRWIGYLPLYKDTHRPVVVIVGESVKAPVDRIEVHAPIFVWRDDQKGATISVRSDDWSKRWQPPQHYHGIPDIRLWLLTLWKEPALTSWFEQNGMAADPTAAAADSPSPPGVVPQSPSPVDEVYKRYDPKLVAEIEANKAAVKARRAGAAVSEFSELSDQIARRAAAVVGTQPNGKHAGGVK